MTIDEAVIVYEWRCGAHDLSGWSATGFGCPLCPKGDHAMTVDDAIKIGDSFLGYIRATENGEPLAQAAQVLAAEVRRLRGELVIALGPAPRPISGTMIEASTPKRKETKP
jgi:hypothetical protein